MAPGQVYPSKEHSKFVSSGHANTPTDRNPNLGEGISRKFRIDDFGLAWETIETLQYFIYPGINNESILINPSIHPFILSIHSSFHPSIILSFYLSIHLSIHPSIIFSFYLSIHLSIHPSCH